MEEVLVIIRAAEFWTNWSLWRSLRGSPKRRELQQSLREVTRACTRIAGEFGVRNGRRRLMFRKWKYTDRVILFTCFSKDKVLLRTTPRRLTWVDEEIIELSTESEKLLDFDKLDLVPIRRTSVLSVFSLRKLGETQDVISSKQPKREKKEG